MLQKRRSGPLLMPCGLGMSAGVPGTSATGVASRIAPGLVWSVRTSLEDARADWGALERDGVGRVLQSYAWAVA